VPKHQSGWLGIASRSSNFLLVNNCTKVYPVSQLVAMAKTAISANSIVKTAKTLKLIEWPPINAS